MNLLALARRRPYDSGTVSTRVVHDLDIAILKREHGALGLLGMERKGDHGHLHIGVAHHDAARHVYAGIASVGDGDNILGLRKHKHARHGKGVHANVEHRAASQAWIVKTILRIKILIAAKAHLGNAHVAELVLLGTADKLAVERHMKDGRGIDKLHAVLVGNRARFVELLRIEGNRLLAQYVLAGRKCGAQIVDVRIVRRGDIHRVDSGIGTKLLERIVHAGHIVLLGKSDRLLVCAVVDAGKFAASELER